MREIYTDEVYKKFKEEVRKMLNCKGTKLGNDGGLCTCEVRDISGKNARKEAPQQVFTVLYNEETEVVHCICRLFEFKGFLCSHALYVLRDRDIMYVLDKYIMDRWRKDFKRKYAREKGIRELDSCDSTELERYDAIVSRSCNIVDLGSKSTKNMKIVYEAIKALKQQLEAIVDDVPPLIASTKRQSIKEPTGGHRKGRPRFSLNKAISEKKTNK
ncbi:hypothetical protein Syun_016337 [Stephania yunnanensis]|uniref:Protein FAR1-RELATED SEQUENCE n=1 Tax=Stephania yunnanensis TaxID=152371 RepID=A0AAP0P3T0_9MAGN